MKTFANHPVALLTTALLFTVYPLVARCADPSAIERIIHEQEAAVKAIQSIEYDFTEQTELFTNSAGRVLKSSSGKMIIQGNQKRMELEDRQQGASPSMIGVTNDIMIVRESDLVCATPGLGLVKRFFNKSDNSLSPEAAAVQGKMRGDISVFLRSTDERAFGTIGLFLKNKRFWPLIEVSSGKDGDIVLSQKQNGEKVWELDIAASRRCMVRRYTFWHTSQHFPIKEVESELAEVHDEKGAAAWIPVHVSQRSFRSKDALASSRTMTLSRVAINKHYDKKLFTVESLLSDKRFDKLVEIHDGQTPAMQVRRNGQWVREDELSAPQTRATASLSTDRAIHLTKWFGAGLFMIGCLLAIRKKLK